MKKIYWRPRAVSRTALVLIAILACVGLALVQNYRIERDQPYKAEKVEAAELAAKMMGIIKQERQQYRTYPINPDVDPTESGLVGVEHTPVTSIAGDLGSKQTSVNPNFAAVIFEMLKKAGVKEGDTVAVGVSGSFPALNICTYAALETLKVKPIIIASTTASQWGANLPELLWIDMEKVLHDEGLTPFRASAASLGGYEDRGQGLSEEGHQMALKAIERNGLQFIDSPDFDQAVADRLKLYEERRGRAPIAAYINVGGGTVSVGRSLGKKMFKPGLNRRAPSRIGEISGIMPHFISQNVPVIHLVQIAQLAEENGLPVGPTQAPVVGQGTTFVDEEYNRFLAAGVLIVVLVALFAFIRSDVGYRILRSSHRVQDHGHPEPMV